MTLKPDTIVDELTGLTAYEFMLQPCKTKDDLRNWLWLFLDLDPPDTIVDPESNCSPLDMAWKVYSNCLWYNSLPIENREEKMLFYANRSGFKTYVAAAIEFMVALHDHRGVVHTAATLPQARKCYQDYFKKFLEKPFFKPLLDKVKKNTSDQCVFEDGTNIKIIPVTKQAVQSQHESLLCRDEVDVVEDEGAYYDLDGIPVGMPDATKRPPIDFAISVRKSAFGLVQREIENAKEKGTGVYHWNLIDCTESCPDSRSGTTPTTLYVMENSMVTINEAKYQSLDEGQKKKYVAHAGLTGCYDNCKIFGACQTNLKRQTSKSKWLKTIDEVHGIMKRCTDTVFIASYLCRKPPSEGLAFPRFDEKNMRTYREMYEVFKGEPWPKETMSLDEFVGVMQKYRIPCFAGVDWGYTDPSVCVVMYIDKNENVYIVHSLSRTQEDNAAFIKMMVEDIQPRFECDMYFPDSANPSGISMMVKANLPASKRVEKAKNSIYDGVQVMKAFVTAPGTNTAKLFVSTDGTCDDVLYEFGKYHHEVDASGKIDDLKFADTQNHRMDSIRYTLYTLFGKNQAQIMVVTSEDGPKPEPTGLKDMNGNFLRTPTAAEIAAHLGRGNFTDNREDHAKKVKRSDVPDDDPKTGGSSSGFSWSF